MTAQPRVLVVEDDSEIREAIVEYLVEEGFDVATAENGAVALDRLGSEPLPGVVVLDATMPVLDGPATLARMRANPAWARIPVVFSTADTRAQGIGADRFLAKPFSVDDLVSTLRELLARAAP